MKSLIRTISVIIVLGLATGCLALAKDRTVVESREADRALKDYERQLQLQELNQLNRARDKKKELQVIAQAGHLGAFATSSQYGAGRVLVIPAAQSTAEELLTITEDMSVMSYIFDEKLGQVHMVPDYLGDITFLTRDARGTRGIYLDGYGALFLMKVDFLLSPPAKPAEEEKPEEGVDPVWQQARRKMYEPEKGEPYYRRSRRVSRTRPEEKYDGEKVEELKRKLIRTLKHAANIRNLKPDEQVILSVTGRGESDRVTTEVKVQMIPESGQVLVVKKSGDRQETKLYPSEEVYTASLGPSSPTVMTIRAKKADVDAFYKGEMDFDEFRRKVQIFTH